MMKVTLMGKEAKWEKRMILGQDERMQKCCRVGAVGGMGRTLHALACDFVRMPKPCLRLESAWQQEGGTAGKGSKRAYVQ